MAGLVIVLLGTAFLLEKYYDLDAPDTIALFCIPIGLYIILVPKRIEGKTTIMKSIPEPKKKRFDLAERAKLIVYWVLVAVIVIFLIYHFAAHILGLVLLAVVLLVYMFIRSFFKK